MKPMIFLGAFTAFIFFSCQDQGVKETEQQQVKIFGGQPVPLGQWSSVVSLQSANESYCTGIAIDAQTIVTAAHCVDFVSDNRNPQINAAISSPVTTSSFLRSAIDRVYNHPYYASSYDYGLAFLRSPLRAGLVDYPELVDENDLLGIKVGDEVTLVGYGKTETGSSGKKLFTVTTITEIDNNEILLGTDTHGACNGDSGGPAFIKINDVYKLLGVASRGEKCGSTIYGLITSMAPWTQARKMIDKGLTELQKGNIKFAKSLCEESLLYITGESDAYLCVAKANIDEKEYLEALTYIDEYIALLPYSEDGLKLRLLIHTELGMVAEAAEDQRKLEDIQEILKIKKSWQAFSLAQSDYFSHSWDSAISNLTDAIVFNGAFEKYFAWRALCYMGLNQYDKALDDINIAIQLNPFYYRLYETRAAIFEALGDSAQSEADKIISQKIAYLEQTNGEFQMGQMNFYNLKFKEAVQNFNTAIKIQAEVPVYYLWRSRAYKLMGDATNAALDMQNYQDKLAQFPVQLPK